MDESFLNKLKLVRLSSRGFVAKVAPVAKVQNMFLKSRLLIKSPILPLKFTEAFARGRTSYEEIQARYPLWGPNYFISNSAF